MRFAPLFLWLFCSALCAQAPVTDEAVRAAWDKLEDGDKKEIVEWFSAEAQYLDTFQNRLLAFALAKPERDMFQWPQLERSTWFDPETHAAVQPIPRKWVAAGSSTAKKLRERVFRKIPERRLDSAWVYDYTTREPRRVKDLEDPERLFANALAGFPPNLDYAEVLIERLLDDGSLKKELTVFAHAYTDRVGNAFAGVTLYDVWGATVEMEMPDIDCLGVVHELLDDWKTWKAPVSKQKSLYAKIETLYLPARNHRALRHALARSFLTGDAVLRDNYQLNLDLFHAVWEANNSTPSKLAEELPTPKDWAKWLEGWGKKTSGKPKSVAFERWQKGQGRKQTLISDSARVRATLVRIMREYGALD
jgi:hypothetical protein